MDSFMGNVSLNFDKKSNSFIQEKNKNFNSPLARKSSLASTLHRSLQIEDQNFEEKFKFEMEVVNKRSPATNILLINEIKSNHICEKEIQHTDKIVNNLRKLTIVGFFILFICFIIGITSCIYIIICMTKNYSGLHCRILAILHLVEIVIFLLTESLISFSIKALKVNFIKVGFFINIFNFISFLIILIILIIYQQKISTYFPSLDSEQANDLSSFMIFIIVVSIIFLILIIVITIIQYKGLTFILNPEDSHNIQTEKKEMENKENDQDDKKEINPCQLYLA